MINSLLYSLRLSTVMQTYQLFVFNTNRTWITSKTPRGSDISLALPNLSFLLTLEPGKSLFYCVNWCFFATQFPVPNNTVYVFFYTELKVSESEALEILKAVSHSRGLEISNASCSIVEGIYHFFAT